MVMPSNDPELVLLKPLGGSDEEITGVFMPLNMPGDHIKITHLDRPIAADINDFSSAKLLFDASRLSFRNASGPFRCMGKLSFRPRAYQVVPLVMALKQDVVRLLIADDVGVGKTVEALMILKEMMERGDVRRFAVICLPHLCEQWQRELKDKLDIDAEIIRSSTIATLDRKLPNDDRSVYHHLPAQVISVDFVKSDKRRQAFLADCPDLVIVDEAHSCTKPAGASSPSKQQRYHLLHDIAKKPTQHLLLLTATPHSGKDEEFQSLLGLLDKDFEAYTLEGLDQNKRQKIAKHFIQRKRANIERWHRTKGGDEETPFPKREAKEQTYLLSPQYNNFYEKVLQFARGMTAEAGEQRHVRIRFWAALALLRGVMSSPATALEMLQNRQARPLSDEEIGPYEAQDNPVMDRSESDSDQTPVDLLDVAELVGNEEELLQQLAIEAKGLLGQQVDWKLQKLGSVVNALLKEGYNPIVFCRFIATAKYIGEQLKTALPGKVDLQVVTSELADEQRREKIDLMREHDKRVLIATDCLSEGINLQDHFTAVVHYDLPWNPNRIEQREGRVDRFGQQSKVVKTVLLYGEDNPIDQTVFKILVKKVMDIQRAIGVQISIGEENRSIMEAVIKDILMGTDSKAGNGKQLSLFAEEMIENELANARKKAESLRSIFAHESVAKEEIEEQLDEVDEAIGDVQSVEQFVCAAVVHLGGSVSKQLFGWELHLGNLPPHLQVHFPRNKPLLVSFASPTPAGYRYIGRNHLFVEQLCQFLLALAFEDRQPFKKVARAAVVMTEAVKTKTTLIQFRVRNVIKEVNSSREVISEEMFLWGYRGSGDAVETLDYADAKALLLTAKSKANLAMERQVSEFELQERRFVELEERFHAVAVARAQHLVAAHGGFKKLVGGKRYEAVQPVLPPDLMGVYVLVPAPCLNLKKLYR
jgi:superfamily II DNA or RNA helicase